MLVTSTLSIMYSSFAMKKGSLSLSISIFTLVMLGLAPWIKYFIQMCKFWSWLALHFLSGWRFCRNQRISYPRAHCCHRVTNILRLDSWMLTEAWMLRYSRELVGILRFNFAIFLVIDHFLFLYLNSRFTMLSSNHYIVQLFYNFYAGGQETNWNILQRNG